MNWLSRLREQYESIRLAPPAEERALVACESALRVSLPPELRELLAQSDGVLGEYDLGLCWPAARIEADNIAFRQNASFQELYMPFDSLLFFADAGNGDQFAFPIQGGIVRNSDVFAWNHENDSRTWVAPSLQMYFEWWLSGRIAL